MSYVFASGTCDPVSAAENGEVTALVTGDCGLEFVTIPLDYFLPEDLARLTKRSNRVELIIIELGNIRRLFPRLGREEPNEHTE